MTFVFKVCNFYLLPCLIRQNLVFTSLEVTTLRRILIGFESNPVELCGWNSSPPLPFFYIMQSFFYVKYY